MKDIPPTVTTDGEIPFPPISLTAQDWLKYFEAVDANEAEKIEMIQTLWSMMLTFVDLAWACRSAPETSGQVPDLSNDLRCAVLNLETKKEEV